jgi:hypothetical protein
VVKREALIIRITKMFDNMYSRGYEDKADWWVFFGVMKQK